MLDDYRLLHFLRQEKYLLSLQLKKRRKDLLDHLRRLKLKKKALKYQMGYSSGMGIWSSRQNSLWITS